jgi:DMSO/TMAO reductase YedYZ molybdopterin-dependent catalytic subunit
MSVTRRQFARTLASAGVAIAFEQWLDAQVLPAVPGGRLDRTVPLGRFDGRPAPPLNVLLGTGLDARQFTDLSSMDGASLVTPVERFYVRTSHPPELPADEAWRCALGGLVAKPQSLDLAMLAREAGDRGAHLMECAGNSDPANFGLISAAVWTGVPIGAVLDRVEKSAGAHRVMVTGIDDQRRLSATSNPGASWIFSRDELERAGAFLAIGMNGRPLTQDHGAPVRLVVPNYYGCSCIKWVSRIDMVADDEPATSQMLEFSLRTHQQGVPRLARDYEPPVIDLAAMPIRVERWLVPGRSGDRIVYRVVGIRWGGRTAKVPLTIRFRSGERFVPVSDCPPSDNPTTWSLWSHQWTPEAPGRYQVALGVADRSLRTRRLDIYYYVREVEIDRV